MKRLVLSSLTIFVSLVIHSQTTHQVCIAEVFSAGACNNNSGIFTPGNLTIQQGDQIQFTTHMIALAGYNGTHDIQFDGSPANNVMLTISTNVLAQVTTVTTPPFNTPGTFPMECHNGNHCGIAQVMEGWSCDGYSVTVLSNCTIDADFTASSTEICQGDTIDFTNSSVDFANSEWLVDGNSIDNSTDFEHIFNNVGTSEVKLIVTDGNCSDSTTLNITVKDQPQANLTVSPVTATVNSPVNIDFTAIDTTTNATFLWEFCDGNTDDLTTSFTYSWSAPGEYCVCLSIDNLNGCTFQTCVDPIDITESDNSSVEKLTNNTFFNVYPNPSNGDFYIQLKSNIESISITDVKGKTTQEYQKINENLFKVNDLPKGHYIITVRSNNKTKSETIIVQ